MATILLTDEEYQHIEKLTNELLALIEKATPRAATHYNNIVKSNAKFLGKEDGKRAATARVKQVKEDQDKRNETRRNNRLNGQTGTQPQASGTGTANAGGRTRTGTATAEK